ncbi:hypothetical protein [Vagococcus fessus]|uniref:Uncharacterized protein n=1 Tax=Vagococcus fessus TaxID=120370 RepID=A0A430ABP3_9ENTE|nr:hypothetical protein [Vagococcus fessus]RSU04659.1 hypothetical protein CBF31_01175 [Vagococcus fessus]
MMNIGEIVYYRYHKVEIVEIDYEFKLTLIKFMENQKIEFLSSNQLSDAPINESFISIKLLEGDREWF